jgi:hypothetical protein
MERHRSRIFEDRVLMKIFCHAREEVTGHWKQFYKEELYGLYPSPNFIRVIKLRRMMWAGYVARLGDKRDLLEKPEGNIPRGRPSR